jgi:hypothetical protein
VESTERVDAHPGMRSVQRVERDELIQVAERALFDAEQAYRADPSEAAQRRVQRAWVEVSKARGEPADRGAPFLSSHPPRQ